MNPLRGSCVSESSRCGAVRISKLTDEPSAEIVCVCVESLSLRRFCVSNRSRCGAVRISKLADEPFAEMVCVESLTLSRRAIFNARRRTLCGDAACRRALAVADAPSVEIARVESLSVWRRANFKARALCGDCACRIALAVAGAVRVSKLANEPSVEIVRFESVWRRANFKARRQTLCGDCARRIALAVAPCEFQCSTTNPLRRLYVSNRSRCGAVRICYVSCEPSAEIVRVESLSLRRRANLLRGPRTLCGDCSRVALAVAPCDLQSSPTHPLRRLRLSNRSPCGAVRIFDFADEPLAEILHVSDRSRCGFRQSRVQK